MTPRITLGTLTASVVAGMALLAGWSTLDIQAQLIALYKQVQFPA